MSKALSDYVETEKAMNKAFDFMVGHDGVAYLIFDLPGEKVNKLTMPALEELEQILDGIASNKSIKALVITSGKEDSFIAGADLRSFEKIFKDPKLTEQTIATGHRVFNKLSALPFPTIALINGTCLGGGMELALACKYRVVTDHPKTSLGLPEVSLGIIPGWGGTQRAPRLLGLTEGMGLVLTARPIKPLKAYKIHLADSLVAWEFKDEKIAEFVSQILTPEGRKKVLARRKLGGLKHWLLEANPLGRAFVFHKAEQDIQKKTKGHYPAPLLALQVIKDTYTLPIEKGLDVEAKAIVKNVGGASKISQNLISLFFTSEALKKDTGVPEGIKGNKINSSAVLGAGIMGSGIAALISNNDLPVRMKDIDWNAVGKGYGSISAFYYKNVKDKRMKPNEAALKFQHVSGTVDYSGFQHADLVVEAAVENLDLKNKIYTELESYVPAEAVIASNTSSLSIAEMAKVFKHPERFVGMHFFNPVSKMPLVEVVPGPKTSPQTVATAVEFCKKIGKTPIVVQDCAGFLVNRIFAMGANEILRLFDEGVDHNHLEKVMLGYGFPMGPFHLADEVGNDVMYKVNTVLEKAYGSRMQGPKILAKMYDNKLYGRKVGKGFYIYHGTDTKFNDEVLKWKTPEGIDSSKLSDVEMIDRVVLSMVNEASRCLDEKIVNRPDYLDMAMIMGTGFPPFRGGPLRYADELGINYVVDHLQQFQKKYGDRFAPSNYLLEMQRNNKKFYP